MKIQNKIDKIVPRAKLDLPKATIKTKDWMGKEPYPHKSKMELRLKLKDDR